MKKNIFKFLFFISLSLGVVSFSHAQNACEGTLDATSQLNTSTATAATQIGDGTPGRIKVCITANTISTQTCTGNNPARLRLYTSAGTLVALWTSTTAVGTCYTFASCDGIAYIGRACWAGNATLTWETVDCTDGVTNVCTTPHCSNGIMDADETGIDCGGADCPACTGCTTNELCTAAIPLTNGVTTTGCNIGATVGPSIPAAPLCDMSVTPTVWYSFTTGASDVAATIVLDNTCFTYPQFAIYTNCSTILTSSCVIDGNLSGYTPLTPNTTYLLAVSDYLGAECNFDITVTTYPDASACLNGYTFTASSAGPLTAGQTVNFTFTVTDWDKAACNWLQGIVPAWGPCWDSGSFTSTAPTGGRADGTWYWDPTVTYNVNGGQYNAGDNVGPGWFFVRDGDPGDATNDPDLSWGDQGGCGGACNDCSGSYVFNFSLTVQNICNLGTDCFVRVKTFGDGEVGNWVSPGCQGDLPVYKYLVADPNLCPLPVEMLNFSGYHFEDINILEWETASEENSDYFQIERSEDGINFYKIGVVEAAHNSSQLRSYGFKDMNPLTGLNYYRLMIKDLNGEFGYSRMIVVKTHSKFEITKSYPNPVSDIFNIEIVSTEESQILVTLTDMSGREISNFNYDITKGNHKLEVPVNDLSKGIYFISLQKDGVKDKQTERIKMVVK